MISSDPTWLHLHHLMSELLLGAPCPWLRVLNSKVVTLPSDVVVNCTVALQADEIRHFSTCLQVVITSDLTIDESLAHDTLTDATQCISFGLLLGLLSLWVLQLLLLLNRRR